MDQSTPNDAAIPRRLLRDLYLVKVAKDALALGICVDCRKPLVIIDTWERACPDPACGWTFNLYHRPLVSAPFDPELGIEDDPRR